MEKRLIVRSDSDERFDSRTACLMRPHVRAIDRKQQRLDRQVSGLVCQPASAGLVGAVRFSQRQQLVRVCD
jgi:hypothetical protein